MTFARKALVAATVLAASSFTLADEQTNTGFYLALDAGQASLDATIRRDNVGDHSVGVGNLSQDTQENFFATLGAGYAFNEYVALELGYTAYGDSTDFYFDAATPANSVASEVTDMRALNLSVLGSLPMGVCAPQAEV